MDSIQPLADEIVALMGTPAYDDMSWAELDRALVLASHQVKDPVYVARHARPVAWSLVPRRHLAVHLAYDLDQAVAHHELRIGWQLTPIAHRHHFLRAFALQDRLIEQHLVLEDLGVAGQQQVDSLGGPPRCQRKADDTEDDASQTGDKPRGRRGCRNPSVPPAERAPLPASTRPRNTGPRDCRW